MAAKDRTTISRREPQKAPINTGKRGPVPFDPAHPPAQTRPLSTPPMGKMEQPPATTGYPAAKPTPPKIPTEAPQATMPQEQARTESPRRATISASEAHQEIAKAFSEEVAHMNPNEVLSTLKQLTSGTYGQGLPSDLRLQMATLCETRLGSLPPPESTPLERPQASTSFGKIRYRHFA